MQGNKKKQDRQAKKTEKAKKKQVQADTHMQKRKGKDERRT